MTISFIFGILLISWAHSVYGAGEEQPILHPVPSVSNSFTPIVPKSPSPWFDLFEPFARPRSDRGVRRKNPQIVRKLMAPRPQRVPTFSNTKGIDKLDSQLRYRSGIRAGSESPYVAGLGRRPEHWPENLSEKDYGFLNTYDRARFGDPNAPYMVWSRATMRWEPNLEGITNHEYIEKRKKTMRDYSAQYRKKLVERRKLESAHRDRLMKHIAEGDIPSPEATPFIVIPSTAHSLDPKTPMQTATRPIEATGIPSKGEYNLGHQAKSRDTQQGFSDLTHPPTTAFSIEPPFARRPLQPSIWQYPPVSADWRDTQP